MMLKFYYSLCALPHHIAQGEEVKDIPTLALKPPWHGTAGRAHHNRSTGAKSSIIEAILPPHKNIKMNKIKI